MCELIDVLIAQKMSEDGLKVLSFSGFNQEIDSLEDALVTRLVSKCQKLHELIITRMMDSNATKNLTPMIRQITSNSSATLVHLDLTRYSENAQDGKDILVSLLDSGIASLQRLIL